MNQEHVEQVLNIEREARQIHDLAVRDSEQLVALANQEINTIIAQAQQEAQQKAQQLLGGAKEKDDGVRIQTELDEKVKRETNLARGNFDLAVNYILDRATGKE